MAILFRNILLLTIGILTFSCSEQTIAEKEDTSIVAHDLAEGKKVPENNLNGDTMTSGGIKIYPLTDSPSFNDAILDLNEPQENGVFKKGNVHFSYDIKNYQLSQPTTEGTCASHCANSKQGQHIHLILNNNPYLAKYTTTFDEQLTPGHYVALSFLSRSYHESIKHYEAYDLRQFTVGDKAQPEIDLTQPMLFYSRPKGEYKGEETQKVLLDFYVVNASLGINDYKVRATINGEAFILHNWKGYLMEGLPMGENKVKIELLDKDNKPVQSPYATTERSFYLKEEGVVN